MEMRICAVGEIVCISNFLIDNRKIIANVVANEKHRPNRHEGDYRPTQSPAAENYPICCCYARSDSPQINYLFPQLMKDGGRHGEAEKKPNQFLNSFPKMKNPRSQLNPLAFEMLVNLAKQKLAAQRNYFFADEFGDADDVLARENLLKQASIALHAAKRTWNNDLEKRFSPVSAQNLCSIFRVR